MDKDKICVLQLAAEPLLIFFVYVFVIQEKLFRNGLSHNLQSVMKPLGALVELLVPGNYIPICLYPQCLFEGDELV